MRGEQDPGPRDVMPFLEHGHYTQVHDTIFDEVMPKCPPNAWKVLCLILRKTRGWQKDADAIPYKQIREGTGISSNTTIQKAIEWLVKQGMIVSNVSRDEAGHQVATTYALCRAYTVPTQITENVTPQVTESVTEGVTENVNRPVTETVKSITTEQYPSNNHNSLSGNPPGSPVSEGKKPSSQSPKKRRGPTQEEYEAWVEGFYAGDHLGRQVRRLADRAAAKNKSGTMRPSREWNEFVTPVLDAREKYPEAAIEYALEETNTRDISDMSYAMAVLRNNPDGPPRGTGRRDSIAVIGATADDYDLEKYLLGKQEHDESEYDWNG
jgi:hypothetical protein